ncbi:hypothetical protein HYG77_23625 [Rhodococcus sp. ZPP]|nr:DUF6596 domain-containing protein [Rhodococcus sp. ZPP]QTJ68268.1 hypothetical protein HYG77_23625 [Rhodococcus sp. ZPP]
MGGLLALMLLTDARRPARTGPEGELIPLTEQDRTLWNSDLIAEGQRVVMDAVAGGAVGQYVRLNRAVAAAMVHGPATGLAMLEELDGPLRGHYRLDAVGAHLLDMVGDTRSAAAHYRAAARRTTNVPEYQYLAAQVARLGVAESG